MTDNFIKKLAEARAEKLFTREFFENCTDSWYLDEQFEFEGHEVGINGRHPSPKESDTYMKYMLELKNDYENKFFGKELACTTYKSIINKIQDILEIIEDGSKHYKDFSCTEDIIKNIKTIGNYFVYKFNENIK